MLITEWNTEDFLEVARREAREEAREEAWKEALEEGMERGREEGIEITARNALIEGFSTETIQKITGLNLNTIEEIRQRLN